METAIEPAAKHAAKSAIDKTFQKVRALGDRTSLPSIMVDVSG